MKLDQKQMHIVSQLFMAAGKAGNAFDLGRFTKDPSYASETMAQLALQADQLGNEPLQGLVVTAMEQLASVTMPAPVAAPVTSPSLSTPIQPAPVIAQQYVGKLR